jgi:hypothetical protein
VFDECRQAADEVLSALRVVPPEPERFQEAYDQFLWLVSVSSRETLGRLLEMLQSEPYIGLPLPLQVVIARLVGLEYRDDEKVRQSAAAWVACYCDPLEQQTATAGFRHG